MPLARSSDDRALLPFAGQMIGFYLGERPLLPTLPTYWLGDIDQREMVLAEIENIPSGRFSGRRSCLRQRSAANRGRNYKRKRNGAAQRRSICRAAAGL